MNMKLNLNIFEAKLSIHFCFVYNIFMIFDSYFHWSSCSAGEYHFKSNGWKCAFNYPYTLKNATFIGDVIEYTYSLDDQCRMEFGEGFRFCRSFQVS